MRDPLKLSLCLSFFIPDLPDDDLHEYASYMRDVDGRIQLE